MIRLLAVVMLVACSGRSTAPARPDPRPDGGPHTATVAAAPTEAECDTVLTHALTLENAERPPEQKLSAGEQTKLRTDYRAAFQTDCRAWSREAYRCALASAKMADIAACDAK